MKSDFTSFRADTNTRITNNKDDLQEQIYSTDRYIGEVQSNLNREISDVRKSSFDMLKQTERELIDRFSDQYTEVKKYMVENVEKMRDVTERSATSLTASLKSIKSVCSNYF